MTLETSETKFVEAGGTKYAYRRFGKDAGNPPLVFMQHFTGTMDGWDPLVVNGLARVGLMRHWSKLLSTNSAILTP